MAEIELTKGFVTQVDDADVARLSGRKWSARTINGRYTYAANFLPGGKEVHMHRFLMGDPDGVVDHINGDTLDNRRSNLRVCTARENSINRKKRPGLSSKYKGVYRVRDKWASKVVCHNRHYFLGLFLSERAAAIAYNRAARRVFGEYARLNEV